MSGDEELLFWSAWLLGQGAEQEKRKRLAQEAENQRLEEEAQALEEENQRLLEEKRLLEERLEEERYSHDDYDYYV